jgi:sensor c-di-GMP phosphodiesterase-like protein
MKITLSKGFISVRQTLSILWMLLTVLFLLIALYYQWQHHETANRRKLEIMAEATRAKMDNLLEDILSSAYSLPLYGRQFSSCEKDLLPLLRSIVFSNPNISGLFISDKDNKIICSTLEEQNVLLPPFEEGPKLFGPIRIGELNNIFLLQQRLGETYLGIYLVQKVIENVLANTSQGIKDTILYNSKSKKIVLQHGSSPFADPKGHTLNLAEAQLQNLDDFKVILAADPQGLQTSFIRNLILGSLIILLISSLLYLQLRSILNQRFSLQHALYVALKRNSFRPAYQPVMDITQNKFRAAEILARWFTDTDEITPDSFIEEAEQSGLIVPITIQVLQKAFRESQNLLKTHPDFHLALNISASHFQHKSFFSDFYHLCATYEIRPQQIMLEITERQLLDQNNSALIAKMQELRNKGYSLAIDDFGTGHASIKYLQHFPFNFLKIDKIFIHAIGTGAITENLNQAIIHMANSLGLEIIAEGVETKEQINFLQQSRVSLMQGWFFGKAMPYEQLLQIIEKVKHE